MALGNHYIRIANYDLPNPRSFKVNYQNIENSKMMEDGRDVTYVQRLEKRTWDLKFQVTAYWRNILRSLGSDSINYAQIDGEIISEVRFRIKDETLKEGSEHIKDTNGLWTMQVQIFER